MGKAVLCRGPSLALAALLFMTLPEPNWAGF
jgi:hypothetical protein